MKDLHLDFLRLAAASLDFELTASQREALNKHIAMCPGCRLRVHAITADAQGIRDLPVVEMPRERVARVWRSLTGRHRTMANLRLVAVAALLALLALAVASVGAELMRRQVDDLAVVPPVSPSPTTSVAPTPNGSMSPGPIVSQAPDATWAPAAVLDPGVGAGGDRGSVVTAAATGAGQVIAVGCLAEPLEAGEALCRTPVAWRSSDGVRWDAPVVLSGAYDQTVFATATDVVRFGDVIVAAGAVNTGNQMEPLAWWTTDGRTWTAAQVPGGDGYALGALEVHADIGRIVALGSGPDDGGSTAWYSDDGRTWLSADFVQEAWASVRGVVAASGQGLLAWGTGAEYDTRWWRSADGTTWTPAETPPGLEGAGVMQVARTSDGLIAYGTEIGDGGYEAAFWEKPFGVPSWSPAGSWASAGVTDLLVLPAGAGAVAAAYDALAEHASIWVRPPGEEWRLSSVLGAIKPIVLTSDPNSAERVLLLARDARGESVVWAGSVPWTP